VPCELGNRQPISRALLCSHRVAPPDEYGQLNRSNAGRHRHLSLLLRSLGIGVDIESELASDIITDQNRRNRADPGNEERLGLRVFSARPNRNFIVSGDDIRSLLWARACRLMFHCIPPHPISSLSPQQCLTDPGPSPLQPRLIRGVGPDGHRFICRFPSSSSPATTILSSPDPPTAPPCQDPRPLDCEVQAFSSVPRLPSRHAGCHFRAILVVGESNTPEDNNLHLRFSHNVRELQVTARIWFPALPW